MNGASPLWLSVYTRRVLNPFLSALARSHRWNTVYLISPWISSFDKDAGMTFDQMLNRLCDDDATAYVVTRPPVDRWHADAVERLAKTTKANIRLVDGLHTKLYLAKTAEGDLALLGSANLTQKSLANREIGVVIRAVSDGKDVVRTLGYEAAEIYRMPGSKLYCQRQLSRR